MSIEDQRRECRAYATARGWTIVREFAPSKGFASGLSIDRDRTFLEMVDLAEQRTHGVLYLVVYDVSRFGRLQQEDKIYWERRLKRQGGIDVVYVKDEFKNDGSISDTLLKVIKHSEAHQYSVKLSEVTLRGSKSHAALGHSAGGTAPFGYDRLEIDSSGTPVRVMNHANDWKSNKLNRVVWTPSAANAPIVRSVFETYDGGSGLNTIVDRLNRQSIASPRGRHWSKAMVHYMLRNRAYVGERIYNRRSYRGYRNGGDARLFNPCDQWVVKESAHPAIVDQVLFERVQALLKTKSVHLGRTFHRPYLLTGLVRCVHCGYRMIGQPITGNGHRYLTYTCSGYLRMGRAVCRSVHIHTEALENELVRSIREHLSSPTWADEVRETLESMVRQEFGDGVQERVDEFETQMRSAKREIDNIVEAIKAGNRRSQALEQSLAGLETRLAALGQQLDEAKSRANKQVGASVLADRLLTRFGQFDRIWNGGLGLEDRKALLRCYVHQISVHHSPTSIRAEIWLYKIPIPKTQMTPALNGLEPLITRVNCGGPGLTQVKGVDPAVLPFVLLRLVDLKRPYVHYRSTKPGSSRLTSCTSATTKDRLCRPR